jgi:ABC-2 type transport system permease protein
VSSLARTAAAFLRRDLLTEASYRLSLVIQFVEILLIATIAFFLARFLQQQGLESVAPFARDYFSFVVLGLALFDYLGTALHNFSQTIREGQWTGTLEALLVTETSPEAIILASSLFAFTTTTLRLAAYLLIGVALFGMPLAQANWPAAVALLALSVGAFSGLGILSACFSLLFKKGDPFTWVLFSASGVLGGVFYPVTALPPWLGKLAQWLPITHALEGVRRALLAGDGLTELWREALTLLLFAGVGLPLALAVFRWSVRRAKMTGTLAQY